MWWRGAPRPPGPPEDARLQQHARVQQTVGVESLLDPSRQFHDVGPHLVGQPALLQSPHPVLAGDGAADRDGAFGHAGGDALGGGQFGLGLAHVGTAGQKRRAIADLLRGTQDTAWVRLADGTEVHLSLGAGQAVGKDGMLGIRSNGKRTTTRLLDAEFPKFRQLLPAEHTAVATIGVAELAEAIKRVALVADRGAQVRMEFADDILRLSAGADDVGRAEEDLPVEFYGEPLTIAFNPTYLTDGLGSLHADRVTFGFTTPSKPAVLRPAGENQYSGSGPFPAGDTDYVYLLMPVRLPG